MVKEGFIADLLLVNGDPLKDVDMMVTWRRTSSSS